MTPFRRALQKTLRYGVIDRDVTRFVVSLVEKAEGAEEARLLFKMFLRHERRPGRPRDPERDKRMIEAIAWVRFNRKTIGLDTAIVEAARQFSVTPNALRHAVDGKHRKFRNLFNVSSPHKLNVGETEDGPVVGSSLDPFNL